MNGMADRLHSKVLIIGSGAAGYTAAIYAARANLGPRLIMGMQPGGQLTITTDVENYPGFADPIQGPWLMEQMQAQAAHVGADMVQDLITSVDFSKRPFEAVGDGGQLYTGDVVIIDEIGFHHATSTAEVLADRGCSVEIITPGMVVGQDLGITLDMENWWIRAGEKGGFSLYAAVVVIL